MKSVDLVRAMLGGGDIARSADPITTASWGAAGDLFTSARTASGVSVTERNALQVSTVWSCVRIVSDMVSTLPCDAFIRRDGTRRPYRPRPVWLDEPGRMGRIDLFSSIMVSLLLYGNAYVVTLRSGGRVVGLDVLSPSAVTPLRSGWFDVTLAGGKMMRASPSEIVHVRGVIAPGEIRGMSPIMESRDTIGLAKATVQYGGAYFGNGSMPGVVIEDPGTMTPVGAKIMRDTWEELHRGVNNSHRVAILTEGAKISQVSVNPDDAQFLQTRQATGAEIGAMFGVPLYLLNMEGPQFGDTTSEQGVALVQHTARPWVERIEAMLSKILASDGAERGAFIKLNVSGLMRGDFTQRYATYNTAVTAGILTINEVRALEDLPPVPWGNEPISVQVQDQKGATDADSDQQSS